MKLLPVPKKLIFDDGYFTFNRECAIVIDKNLNISELDPLFTLADKLEDIIGFRPTITRTDKGIKNPIYIRLIPGNNKEAYNCEIFKNKIILTGHGSAGIFYAMQTLLQIIRQSERKIPCLKIEDAPDYKVRGLYFDIARGKIPALDELYKMVDRLASYKVNQFQLYIEYTFAFRQHPDIWGGADPITAEEIIKLNEYCKKNHIELVPSLSTFGHFGMPIKSKRKEHLNEMDIKASEGNFSWWERVGGYTLDVSNHESIQLVEEMIDELAPLFSTKIFNICCDETWDLGEGKNKALAEKFGKGKLYCDFVNKIAKIVNKHNMIPMIWGDVILHHPELIEELPKDAIVLNYDTQNCSSPKFKNANVCFYTCVQLSVQDKWWPDIDTAIKNILQLLKEGYEYGAIGYLSNEWGDAGHINFHTNALFATILGSSLSWNVDSYNAENIEQFGKNFSFLEFGDTTGKTASVIHEISKNQIISWKDINFWIDHFIPQDWREKTTNAPDSLVNIPDTKQVFDAWDNMKILYEKLADIAAEAKPVDLLVYKEMLLGARGVSLMLEISLLLKRAAGLAVPESELTFYGTADRIRLFETDFQKLWHKRNRPSEYYRIKLALMKVAKLLEEFSE